MLRKVLIRIVAWSSLLPILVYAVPVDLAPILNDFLKATGTPGISVSVMEKGASEPYTLSLGLACVGNHVLLNDSTVMNLGSVTKMFTALRIEMLIQSGQLTAGTPISKFFPDFPKGKEILVRHLVNHTSGIPDFLRIEPFTSNLARDWTPAEMLDGIKKAPLKFDPGTQQEYSNSGYFLLEQIIEKVTGRSFQDVVQHDVAEPLGMHHLAPGSDFNIVMNEACGYSQDKQGNLTKPMKVSFGPSIGSGNLVGTAEAVIRLVNMGKLLKDNLLDNPPQSPERLDNGQIAKRFVQWEDMAFDQSFLNGMTGFFFHDRKMTIIGKSGMYPGYASWFLYDPATKTAVAVCINQEARSMEAMRVGIQVFEAQRRLKNIPY